MRNAERAQRPLGSTSDVSGRSFREFEGPRSVARDGSCRCFFRIIHWMVLEVVFASMWMEGNVLLQLSPAAAKSSPGSL